MSNRARGINKKLLRTVNGRTDKVDSHTNNIWELAERTVLKESGGIYRRPNQMHADVLADHRCITAFRRGR